MTKDGFRISVKLAERINSHQLSVSAKISASGHGQEVSTDLTRTITDLLLTTNSKRPTLDKLPSKNPSVTAMWTVVYAECVETFTKHLHQPL